MRTRAILIVLAAGVLLFWSFFFWRKAPAEDPIVPAPEVTITIPEGFTLQKIGQRVREALPHISEEEWMRAVSAESLFESDSFVRNAKKSDDVDLEGYLFPETYRFFSDASAEDVVGKMLRQMDDEVSPLWFPDSELTLHEILTLASMIEREVRTDADRALVADIFLRRLDTGMALQADSTVNYVTGSNTPSVSNKDRQIDSRWNTYLYPGLPPGPIASPGLASITAVVFPEANEYWYFLTDAEGVVHYARTNDEHNANKANYLR